MQDHGITVAEIHRNLPPSMLYEDASIAQNGALVAYSGVKTGSPKDKRVVKQGASENDIW